MTVITQQKLGTLLRLWKLVHCQNKRFRLVEIVEEASNYLILKLCIHLKGVNQ